METTEIVAFYQVKNFLIPREVVNCIIVAFSVSDIFYCPQNTGEELYLLFEQFCDHFHTTSKNLLYMNFISSHANNIHAREQLRSVKNKSNSSSQVNFNVLVNFYLLKL